MWPQFAIIAAIGIGSLVRVVRRRHASDLGCVSAQWRAEHVADPD